MKIILTNDDGLDAPGLQALFEILQGMGRIIVVAPEGPCSGFGHQVTTHAAIAVRQLRPDWYGVKGTPADCGGLLRRQGGDHLAENLGLPADAGVTLRGLGIP